MLKLFLYRQNGDNKPTVAVRFNFEFSVLYYKKHLKIYYKNHNRNFDPAIFNQHISRNFGLYQYLIVNIIQCYRRIAVFVQRQNQINLQIYFDAITDRPTGIAKLIINNDFDFENSRIFSSEYSLPNVLLCNRFQNIIKDLFLVIYFRFFEGILV